MGGGGGAGGEGEGDEAFSALLRASRRRCVRLAASATLTRDPAKLARLRLWRPRFVAVGGGWDAGKEAEAKEREGAEDGVEVASDGYSSDDDDERAGAEEEELPPPPPSSEQTPKREQARYSLPPGLSLRRVDVGGRGGANKPAVLLALLRSLAARGQRSVVFCASVAGAESVARFLENVEPPLRISRDEGGEKEEEESEGASSSSIGLLAAGGAATPAARRAALLRFASFALPVLVCSDGATRGLDLGAGGQTAVISYDPPAHAKALVHRAGRAVRGEGGGVEKSKTSDGGGKLKSSNAAAAAVGTAYTLLRPQDAAFHKELLRKVAGEAAVDAPVGEGEEGAAQQPFSPAAAQQLLKALKLPRADLKKARKEAEAAVERLNSVSGGGGLGVRGL